jgi:predicted CXXCH cytochrome family protein
MRHPLPLITGILTAVIASAAEGQLELKLDALPKLDITQFVGAQQCATCHASHFDGWQSTLHSKMVQRPVSEGPGRTILGDFSIPSTNHPALKDVKGVVGSRWKQRYLVEVNGEEVVFNGQWSVQEKKWQPYTAKQDWWWESHQDWRQRSNFKLCAGCHSTGLDVQAQQWRELNISCESCHGAGRKHSETSKLQDIINPARLTRDRSMDVCLSCHQSGRPHGAQTEYAWAVGYKPGDDLGKYWKGFEPEAKVTPEFWPNGTAHKNRVQGNTFVQSAMHDRKLQCSNCHDSHSGRHTGMTLKSASDNALCLTCHSPGQKQQLKEKTLSEHTHHAATSTGSRCIECHMAKTGENSVAAEARNHTFDFISPAATLKNGNPNSCNLCHKDKTAAWSLEFVQKWYPR